MKHNGQSREVRFGIAHFAAGMAAIAALLLPLAALAQSGASTIDQDDLILWIGVALLAGAVVGSVLTYLIARMRIEKRLLKNPGSAERWQEGNQAKQWLQTNTKPAAYHLYWLGREQWRTHLNQEGYRLAHWFFDEASKRDPNFAMPYVFQARMHQHAALNRWSGGEETSPAKTKRARDEDMEQSNLLARKALKLDPKLADAHAVIAHYQEYRKEWRQALSSINRALRLNRKGANLLAWKGKFQIYSGDTDAGLANVELGLKYASGRPAWMLMYAAAGHLVAGRYNDAVVNLKEASDKAPDSLYIRAYLAAAQQGAGDTAEAEKSAAEVKRLQPEFVAAEWMEGAMPFRDNLVVRKSAVLALLNGAGL